MHIDIDIGLGLGLGLGLRLELACSTREAVSLSAPTPTTSITSCPGLRVRWSTVLREGGMVAEKQSDCRSRGSAATMSPMLLAKPCSR